MNKHGLYSKAAQIIRGLAQERGTAEQMIAAAKSRGMKDAELQNFGPLPTGKISREDLAQAFEGRIPDLRVDQYGENPAYLSRMEQIERKAMRDNPHNIPMMPFEQRRLDELNARHEASSPVNVVNTTFEDSDGEEVTEPVDTLYSGYNSQGGTGYRERLLRLDDQDHPAEAINRMINYRTGRYDREKQVYGEDHPISQQSKKSIDELTDARDRALQKYGPIRDRRQSYQSSHWADHPDVLAHIRMQDRMVGNRKMLHVEELQSDWGQAGRDQGFNDNSAKKAYDDHVEDMRSRMKNDLLDQGMPESVARPLYEDAKPWHLANYHGETDKLNELRDAVVDQQGKVPAAPYVTNTQHWTDLALKNVLREAALGNYDGVVFTPGQAQADRYGLEKHVDNLSYHPKTKTLMAMQGNRVVFNKEGMEPEEVAGHVGREVSQKLLHPDALQKFEDGDQFYNLSGDDLKVGGQGMKGYYDQIVPKSVMKLAQQHDPSVAPGQPVPFRGDDGTDYQGFHLPMTDKLKQGILNEGFPAFRRGGRVAFAQGGRTDDQDAGTRSATSAQEGELPVAGGVRGGSGLLQAQGEPPLEGLPTSVRIPLTGETLQAGPDPRIRAIARDYMSRAGMPYSPPTKYAKVDPARAKRIAAAYEAMPHNPSDPLTKASYDAMIKETLAQYQAAKAAGFRAEFWNPSKDRDPYEASPRMAVEDVRKNHHMWVYPTLDGYGSGAGITEEEAHRNPMLQLTGETWNGIPVTVNDIFRAVHDYYGHAKEGVGFRHDGEENAWRSHASMYSPLARLAMTTETRGQNSWLNFGPHGDKNQTARTEDTVFAPQKMGILPHWAHYEGAEDFMGPQDIAEMSRQRSKHSENMDRALALTRRFTKDGQHVTMRLKD